MIIEGRIYEKGYHKFEVYEPHEPIEMGDYYLFYLGNELFVDICNTESKKKEINPNKTKNLITKFWRFCFKIKNTDSDLDHLVD